jgi:hypothetical protein
MGDGHRDHGDELPGPGSQLDQRCDERDVKHAAFRSVMSVLVRFVVRSFSTNQGPADQTP